MDYLRVTILTTKEGIEYVSGRLCNIGINGWEVEDFEEFEEFLESTKDTWNYVDNELIERMRGDTRVITYFSNNASGLELLNTLKSEILSLKETDIDSSFGKLEILVDDIKEEDWANNWKKYFKPTEVGDNVVIVPEWEQYDNIGGRVAFTVDPGPLFGTGLHETTQLCIKEIEKESGRKRMLDIGCGSGILSIIWLMLSEGNAVAVDIDANVVDVAYANSDMNLVSRDRYLVIAGDVLAGMDIEGEFDIVVANIVADVVIALLPLVKEKLSSNGVFISSGIIKDREADIDRSFKENGLKILSKDYDKEWVIVKAVKE